MDDQPGLASVCHIDHHETGVAPGSRRPYRRCMIGMVQTVSSCRCPVGLLPGREVHTRQPVSSGLTGLCRVGHVDGDEDVVGEAVEQGRRVSPAAARIPDPVDAAALDGHEADLPGFLRPGYVVDGHACRPVALRLAASCGGTDFLAQGSLVIGVLVLELRRREHVLGVDHQKQVLMCLEMDVPCVRRRGHVFDRARIFRVAHVNHAEALREHVADIGVAIVDHELDPVRATALIGVADDLHVLREVWLGQVKGSHGFASGSGTRSGKISARCGEVSPPPRDQDA